MSVRAVALKYKISVGTVSNLKNQRENCLKWFFEMNPYHVKGYQDFEESLQYWIKECITGLQLPDAMTFPFLVR